MEFHNVVVIVVPVHATQLDCCVWRPNIVIENVAVLSVYARVRIGKRRSILQMWEIHIISFFIRKWVVFHVKHHPF